MAHKDSCEFGLALSLALHSGPGDEGWSVNSVCIIRPKTGAPYAIAIVMDARPTCREGIEVIESISEAISAQMHAAQH